MTETHALPIYRRTAERLIREIAAGHLIDGERLPPERDMAARLGISVGTLRKSLADLEGKGLLERRHGSGNYVRAGWEARGVYALFRLELADGGGGLPTAEVLSVARRPKPIGAPNFGPAADGHRIRRLRHVGDAPAALEEIWLDGSRAETVRKEDLFESLYLYYRDRLDLVVARAEDRIGVGPVPPWRVEPFGLAAGALAGFIERIGWDETGAPMEYSRTWYDPGQVRYVARLR
ncbi:MAG: GntR family transcriptional regulator [Pseudomonadota bacterium]